MQQWPPTFSISWFPEVFSILCIHWDFNKFLNKDSKLWTKPTSSKTNHNKIQIQQLKIQHSLSHLSLSLSSSLSLLSLSLYLSLSHGRLSLSSSHLSVSSLSLSSLPLSLSLVSSLSLSLSSALSLSLSLSIYIYIYIWLAALIGDLNPLHHFQRFHGSWTCLFHCTYSLVTATTLKRRIRRAGWFRTYRSIYHCLKSQTSLVGLSLQVYFY